MSLSIGYSHIYTYTYIYIYIYAYINDRCEDNRIPNNNRVYVHDTRQVRMGKYVLIYRDDTCVLLYYVNPTL